MYSSFNSFCNEVFGLGRFAYGGYIMMGIGLILILGIAYLIIKKDSILKNGSSDSPLEVLQKRYVNGEISKEEFLEKKEILK